MSQPTVPSEDERSRSGLLLQMDIEHKKPVVSSSTGHRHQGSLETIVDFNHVPLTSSERTRGENIFDRILKVSAPAADSTLPFDTTKLLRISLEEIPSEQGKDNFLNYVLRNHDPMEDDTEPRHFSQVLDSLEQVVPESSSQPPEWVASRSAELAKLLVYFFFLPLKGQAAKTPQPTPHLTPVGDGIHTPTLNRISKLRATCLARDNHRCVISGYFDQATAEDRESFVDDSNRPLTDGEILVTEVAHIIPHALGQSMHENAPLSSEKSKFWDVMKMFHPEMEHLLNGVEIDRPFNAMTLTADLHRSFGNLRWYLEEDSHQPKQHTYLFKDSPGVRARVNPMFRPRDEGERVQFVSANNTDLPEPGLLSLHRACARILGLSGAGEYIDKLLRDDEKNRLGRCVPQLEQGQLDLAGIVSWRLASFIKSA
ncbi:hypothetical protein GP486_007985 [Trichoglossum hirsutum]|uniref:HNH nuclease domain-containing protein n=1 Tax=Trichoglossum hirsutum TaxID=265104 RepID=A0A9P8IAQ7_9PEZI|nr:hypothetical protein GP486_007985 [Trichoglossum hirsutum]